MKKLKKLGSFLCALALTVSCFSATAFAAETNSIPEVEATEVQDVGIQTLSTDTADVLPAQEFGDLETLPQTEQLDSALEGIPNNALNARENWAINDPVFVGNGKLTDSFDIYVVNLTAKQLAFLKLNSSNPNLMAVLYYVNNGALGNSTGDNAVTDVEVHVTVSRGSMPFYLVVVSPDGREASKYISGSTTVHFDEFIFMLGYQYPVYSHQEYLYQMVFQLPSRVHEI